MYVFIHIYVNVHICIYLNMYICVHIYTYVGIWLVLGRNHMKPVYCESYLKSKQHQKSVGRKPQNLLGESTKNQSGKNFEGIMILVGKKICQEKHVHVYNCWSYTKWLVCVSTWSLELHLRWFSFHLKWLCRGKKTSTNFHLSVCVHVGVVCVHVCVRWEMLNNVDADSSRHQIIVCICVWRFCWIIFLLSFPPPPQECWTTLLQTVESIKSSMREKVGREKMKVKQKHRHAHIYTHTRAHTHTHEHTHRLVCALEHTYAHADAISAF